MAAHRHFAATSVRASGARAAEPQQAVLSSAAVVATAAGPAKASTVLSSNKPVAREVSTLFIPSERAQWQWAGPAVPAHAQHASQAPRVIPYQLAPAGLPFASLRCGFPCTCYLDPCLGHAFCSLSTQRSGALSAAATSSCRSDQGGEGLPRHQPAKHNDRRGQAGSLPRGQPFGSDRWLNIQQVQVGRTAARPERRAGSRVIVHGARVTPFCHRILLCHVPLYPSCGCLDSTVTA